MTPRAIGFVLLAGFLVGTARAAPQLETFSADANWRALEFTPARIAAGSALDFSALLRAPAGRDGDLVIRGGHFVASRDPGRPFRFYGVVMSHGMPFGTKAESDQLVDYLAACGYNLVRLHLYTAGTPSVMQGPDSPEFKPEARDRLDYFLAGLRRKGIYYMFPLNGWGWFDGALIHDVPELKPHPMRADINPYLPISRDASNWFKEFSSAFLTHRNPYTGVALKDDPALLGIELSNEDSLFWELHRTPAVIPIYQRVQRERLGASATAAEAEAEFPEFVLNLQDEFYSDFKSFLRGIGVNKPLTDATDHDPIGHVLNRSRFDFVDLHGYWALYHAVPGGSGETPAYLVSLANPNTSRWGTVLSATAPGRIFGKPFASGEYNSSYPTPYWTFTGPFEAALAAEQDWSALARCGLWPYPQQAFHPSPSLRIESGHSPVMMLSERIGALLFSQGDLAPLPAKVPMVFTPEYLHSKLNLRGGPAFPPEYVGSAFRCQIGSVLWHPHADLSGYPLVALPADEALPADWPQVKVLRTGDPAFTERLDRALSEAGYPASPAGLVIDAHNGSARIVTARSEAFLLPPEVGAATGSAVAVTGNTSTSVVFAGSLDRRPLAQSRHILALYLTEVRNTGTVVEAAPKNSLIVRRNGTTPLLLRQGLITLSLHHDGPAPQVWALRFDGTRASELRPRAIAGGFACSLPAFSTPAVFSAFELTWNPTPSP